MNYAKELLLKEFVRLALKEDIGSSDITTTALVPKDRSVRAVIRANEPCVACGVYVAGVVFKQRDKKIRFKALVKDGQKVKKNTLLARISGPAQGILTAERVALNFIGMLSGIATKTREYAQEVRPYKVKILDTRKTFPGLRELEKYAVRQGGGYNHRMRLDEMYMVKDNHIKVIGDRLWVLGRKEIRKKLPGFNIEVEVNSLKEFRKALKLAPDIIMLDNMSLPQMKRAVLIKRKEQAASRRRILLEASGGITLKNVKKVASCGVDLISVGSLTHSVRSADISLDIL